MYSLHFQLYVIDHQDLLRNQKGSRWKNELGKEALIRTTKKVGTIEREYENDETALWISKKKTSENKIQTKSWKAVNTLHKITEK